MTAYAYRVFQSSTSTRGRVRDVGEAVAGLCNDEGRAYLSVDQIAKVAGCGRTTTKAALAELQRRDEVRIFRHQGDVSEFVLTCCQQVRPQVVHRTTPTKNRPGPDALSSNEINYLVTTNSDLDRPSTPEEFAAGMSTVRKAYDDATASHAIREAHKREHGEPSPHPRPPNRHPRYGRGGDVRENDERDWA